MAKVVLALILCFPSIASAQKLVILVRHAERADGGSMSPNAEDDPELSTAGKQRAARLAAMLEQSGVQAIFTTDRKRTRNTVMPLAEKLGLKPETHPSGDTAGLVATLKKNHASDIVLIAGHSNTLPAVIKSLGGPAVTIPDPEYDNIFVFVPATGALTRIKY